MTKDDVPSKMTAAQKYFGSNWILVVTIFAMLGLAGTMDLLNNEHETHVEDRDIHIDFEDREQFSESSKPNSANTERIVELEKQVAALEAEISILLKERYLPLQIEAVEE